LRDKYEAFEALRCCVPETAVSLELNRRGKEICSMPKLEQEHKTTAPGPGTKVVNRMYPNRVGLAEEVKSQVVQILQSRLADALDVYSQAKFAHWNVKGDNFYQLHLVFDQVAKSIRKQVDPIAERITQLGGVANGTVRQSASQSRIPEYPVDTVAGMDHVRSLADAVGYYSHELREASKSIEEAGDGPTADFLNQLIVDADEQLYFLESHLEAGDVQ
jgi:starvation-inducible DNA-binding protein